MQQWRLKLLCMQYSTCSPPHTTHRKADFFRLGHLMKSKPPGLGPIFKYADEAQSDHVRPSKGTNSAAPNLVARKKGGQPQWGASESLHRAPVWTTLRSFCKLQATVTAWFPPGWIGEPTCRGFILFEEEDCDGEQIAVTFYYACMYGDHEIRLEDVVALEPEQTGFGCELGAV